RHRRTSIFPYTTLFRSERTVGVHSRIVAVVEKCSLSYINEKEFLKVFSGVIDMVYFADMARPIESAEKILKAEGGIQADAVINRSEEHTSELQSRFDLV